jgi:predicted enzyme related to lactoylglutathione lyase
MGNPFVHLELNTGDVAKAKAFYKKLFDWKLKDESMGPGMTYTMLDAGKAPGGGMQQKPMPDAPTAWLPYVEVADVKRAIAKAEKNGATIVVPFMQIGPNGSLGIFIDPTGAALGVWTAAKKPAKKPAKKKGKR